MLPTQAVGMGALCFLVLSAPQLQRQSPGLSGVSRDLLFSFIPSCENLHFHALQSGTMECERAVHFVVTLSYLLGLGVQFGFQTQP